MQTEISYCIPVIIHADLFVWRTNVAFRNNDWYPTEKLLLKHKTAMHLCTAQKRNQLRCYCGPVSLKIVGLQSHNWKILGWIRFLVDTLHNEKVQFWKLCSWQYTEHWRKGNTRKLSVTTLWARQQRNHSFLYSTVSRPTFGVHWTSINGYWGLSHRA